MSWRGKDNLPPEVSPVEQHCEWGSAHAWRRGMTNWLHLHAQNSTAYACRCAHFRRLLHRAHARGTAFDVTKG
jgi:hypothetical protein